ncbi:MAG: SIR2 family protein, partial [Myxococcota bacterium]
MSEWGVDINKLINSFSEKLSCGIGMIFIGSGISAPSGLPTWSSLLDEFADSINLKLDYSDNLPLIAQFIVNSNGNNRGPLMQAIKEKLIGKFPLNSYHEHLQKTNVKTVWTTNYDTLIEDTFRGFI